MEAGGSEPRSAPGRSPSPADRLPPVPSPLGRKVLAFEFVLLLEYWIAPLFIGLTNYAGLWSDFGFGMFFVLVGSLIVFVFWPLRPHLARALARRRSRLVFHAVWSVTFVVGLFAVNIIQFTDGPAQPWILFGQTTVYSPFGAWPSLTMWVPALRMWATWNLEGPAVLLLLSLLSASSLTLGPLSAVRACPVPAAPTVGWRSRLASAGILAPLGFISGCPGCAPAYFAALATFAPATAEGASASIPLVPWIGFAGLLYLLGFWLAVWLIRRATTVDAPQVGSQPEGLSA